MRSTYAESFKARLRAQTLADIGGLDSAAVGFARAECCGDIPKGLTRSAVMGPHFYYATHVPSTLWGKRSENIPGCAAVQAAVAKAFPKAGFTAFHDPNVVAPPGGAIASPTRLLQFTPDEAATFYKEYDVAVLPGEEGNNGAAVEWDGVKGGAQGDTFVFVCSHLTRDARCGYCGPILADLLEQATEHQSAAGRVGVYRCAHIGGHIYAGNVLVYNRHGAISYGLIGPDDVDAMAAFILSGTDVIPAQLQNRVRGKAGRWQTIQ